MATSTPKKRRRVCRDREHQCLDCGRKTTLSLREKCSAGRKACMNCGGTVVETRYLPDPPDQRRKKRRKRSRLADYGDRNRLVRAMGFPSYDAYLQSPKWAAIKAHFDGCQCVGCPAPAEQIHHGRYTPESLSGESLDDLFPVCKRCHQYIEFSPKGRKCTPQQAARRLMTLSSRKYRRHGIKTPRSVRKALKAIYRPANHKKQRSAPAGTI